MAIKKFQSVKKKPPPTHAKKKGTYHQVFQHKPFMPGSEIVNSGHRSKDKRPQGAGLGLGYSVDGEHY